MTKISIIAAIGKNRELGKDNKLLWNIPEDLKHFKEITLNHPIIMGRKTFESIGRILPNRLNIIITRDKEYKIDGAIIVHSLEEGIEAAKKKLSLRGHDKASSCHSGDEQSEDSRIDSGQARMTGYEIEEREKGEIFIIGGGQIFEQGIKIADKLYMTIVDASFDADTFFPDYSMFNKVISEQEGESGEFRFRFVELTR